MNTIGPPHFSQPEAASVASTKADAAQSRYPLRSQQILGLLPWIPAGPVCDLGCGSGHLAAAIVNYGLPVTAVDIDAYSLSKARQRYGDRVDWVHSDLRAYRLQRESYAAILCLDVFAFIPNGERARLIGRLKAALKPGGILILSSLNEDDSLVDQKLARASNQITRKPTGLLQRQELVERLFDWETLFHFCGSAQIAGFADDGQRQVSQIVARKPLVFAATDWSQLPQLGAGIAWRSGLNQKLAQQPDFIEVLADHYLEPHQDTVLAKLAQRFTITLRSQDLSLGSTEARSPAYLQALQRLLARCDSPWWTEHLAYSHVDGRESYLFHALPPTEEALELVKRNLRQVRTQIPTPLLLENTVYLHPFAQADMDPAGFFNLVVTEADCGISLNLGHLLINQATLGIDPYAFIDALPAERLIQLQWRSSLAHPLVGMHLPDPQPSLWALTEYVLQRASIRALCLQLNPTLDLPDSLRQRLQQARTLLGLQI